MRLGRRTALAGAAALATPILGRARAQTPEAVRIGVLADMSGSSMDLSGPGSVLAVQMAVEDAGGSVLGRPITVVSGDHQLKSDVGAEIARRWYDTEGVTLITTVPVSAVGLAVQAVSREKRRLYITTGTGTSDFTDKFCSPYGMQWVYDTTALANSTARALVERGGKTWFFLVADYAFGLALERDATRVIEASGGKVIGSVRHPFNSSDLTSFVVQAQASGADVIALANGPPDNTNAIKQAHEFGIGSNGQTLAGLFVEITDIHSLGLDAMQGLVLTTGFYWDADDPKRAWSKRFFARTGRMPSMVQAGDYSAASHYLKAVKAAGTTDADKVVAMMRQIPVEDMFASKGMLRVDGLMVHDLYLARVKKPSEQRYPWDYLEILATVPGETAFPRLEDEGCPLVGKGSQ
jgi:branched-chain amino acid transport system substrate-binding protein